MMCKPALFILVLFSFWNLEAQFFTLRPEARQSFRIVNKREADSLPRQKDEKVDSISSKLEGFSSPLGRELIINSGFGLRKDPFTRKAKFHRGVDLHSRSEAVLNMLGGRVKKTGYDKRGYGNYVTMSYGDFEVTYAHLSSILVSEKDILPPGEPLGISGSTGRSTGDHLHISLKFKGKSVDPTPFLLFVDRRAKVNEQRKKEDTSINTNNKTI